MKTPSSQQSLGGYAKAAAVGGAFGAAGGVAGKALGALGSKALNSLGSRAGSALSRASGAEAGAASGGRAGASTSTLGGRVAKALCNCFPAGTRVATANGAKAIQQIRVGDRVWARDLTSGRSQLRQVTGLFSKRADRLVRISVAGVVIRVTPQHPFYSPDKGWVDAGHLHQGDRLLARDGRTVTVKGISSHAARTTVYNFEVAGDHNYYVSTAQLLVHNCPTGGSGAGEAAGTRGAADSAIPDATVVVRGGQGEMPPAGQVFSGAQGRTLKEAAAGVPHGTIRSTTAGEIRAGGGSVEYAPEFNAKVGRTNYQHVDVCLGEGSCPFSSPFANPVPKQSRFGFPNYPYEAWEPQ
jgi:hypothetical protein